MKKIKSLKNNKFSRNLSLLKLGVKSAVSGIKNLNTPGKMIEDLVGKRPDELIKELSLYKGSITKAGQLLSQYGEYYLPDEINEKLRSLQTSTHFLDFETLKEQIAPKIQSGLDINPTPIAAASIGQVHEANFKADNKKCVIKVQYKGIRGAIKTDLAFLQLFVKGLKILPKKIDVSDIFDEIERVMTGEMDYRREATITKKYAELLDDPFFYIPHVYDEYSDEKVLCLEFLSGKTLGENLSKLKTMDERHLLGQKIFDLFLKEIFIFHLVQTDAHGGNYLIDLNEDPLRLKLIDFGACLEFEPELLSMYQNFLRYSYREEKELFLAEFYRFIEFTGKELVFNEDLMWEYMLLATGPLKSNDYDWGSTDLPEQIMELGKELFKQMEFKSIPAQFTFLDRKTVGVFTLLKGLNARFDVKSTFLQYLKD